MAFLWIAIYVLIFGTALSLIVSGGIFLLIWWEARSRARTSRSWGLTRMETWLMSTVGFLFTALGIGLIGYGVYLIFSK